ncbi:MAG: DNA polymerase [Hyphomicrobiaceae bacterium]
MISQPHFSSIYVIVCHLERCGGDRPSPVYSAVLDYHSCQDIQIGMPKLNRQRQPPYPTGPQALLVTIQAEDLAYVHLALGWRMPERVLDLTIEFWNMINGRNVPCGPSLAGALIWFGLPAAPAITRGDAPDQVRRLLRLLARLFERMSSHLDWGRALLRGRYLMAVTRIEATGIPVDEPTLAGLSKNWRTVQTNLIAGIDDSFGFYRGYQFQVDAFEDWLATRGIDWPRNAFGRLDLSDDVFKERARAHPDVRPLKELRATIGAFQPGQVLIGRDGRNRTPMRPFASRTGRNQPSAKASILGGPAWIRFLVRPDPGKGLALIDWCQQEFSIAAALSGDTAMQAAYQAGDPYVAFAVTAGAAPEGATAVTHPDVRAQFKACALGVQYGMGARTLARMLNTPLADAERLLERHRRIFPRFWHWSDAIEAEGLLHGRLHSVFGWQVAVGADANPRFLRNFPMQANGAEMLRLACCLTTEAGIRVCATLHDALLIEANLEDLEKAIADTQRLMAEASAIVLDGFELRSEVRCVRYPGRLGDERGRVIWSTIEKLMAEGRS